MLGSDSDKERNPSLLSHEQTSLLLPWFVNGSLREAEQRQVQQHLDHCVSCRRELADQERLSYAMRKFDERTGNAQDSYNKLAGRLRRPDILPVSIGSVFRAVRDLWFDWNISPQLGYGTTVLLLIAFAFALPYGDGPSSRTASDHVYRTLAASKSPDTKLRSSDIYVAFRSGTGERTIHELTEKNDLRLVAGPDSAGVYTLRSVSEQRVPEVIARLRKTAAVSLAIPVVTTTSEEP